VVDGRPEFEVRIDSAESGDPGSKTTLIRSPQPAKQFSESVSIDEGRQMDYSAPHEKTPRGRFEHLDPDSNVKLERFTHKKRQPSQMVSTDDGMQIDSSEGQLENACSPRMETRHLVSNVTVARFLQPEKHCSETVSSDEGIQIDSSEDLQNADLPRIEIRESDLNLTDETRWQRPKQASEISSISREIRTSGPSPKYRITQVPPRVARKPPETRKKRLPGSTAITRTGESKNGKPVTRQRPAGKQIDCNAEQSLNTDSPRAESFEPVSNVKVERLVQPRKQKSEIVSTVEGMQSDSSPQQ
jgi:hypothetical protein